jgi:hypothetical protein
LNDLAPYCILNVDTSKEPGSHWISLAKMKDGNTLFYDSIGRIGTKLIPNVRYSGNGRIIDADCDPEQGIKQENCNGRCLSFLCIFDKWGEDVAKLI